MNRLTLSLAFAFFSVFSFSQDSASVLFLGNSYTGVNNLPSMVQQVATSLGDILFYDANTPGGTTMAGHAGNPTTYAKINWQPWDFVVLQGQSQEPSFSDAQVNSQTLPYAIQIADSVYANSACSQMLFYMTWGRENGDPQWGPISTFHGMNSRLRNAYLRFADSVSGSVSPVGSAWAYVRDYHPAIDLYTSDGSHPSIYGSYLAACTFYASIFRKSPIGASYTGGLSAADAFTLQNAAAMTVLDSLNQWGLHPASELATADFSFGINQSEVTFTNESERATSFWWDFADGNVASNEHPVNYYSSTGTFPVTLIASSTCGADTVVQDVAVTTLSLLEKESGFDVKTLSEGVYEISGDGIIVEVEVVGISGTRALKLSPNNQVVVFDLSQHPKGTYFVQLNTKEEMYRLQIDRKSVV